ncbi:putative baseplate assembly protein [Geodermatophilus sp. URMC 60]
MHVAGSCGCCLPPATVTPETLANRPALDEVRYRVGSYPTFRQAMIELVGVLGGRLTAEAGLAARPLERWTARDSDDYGIAVLEMWATVADILTFYQERYANEAWLRTARQRSSVRRLAGLLGYRPKPGVAAATLLAVTVEEGAALTLPAGTRAQSVPGDGEKPQQFETDEALLATSSLNRVPVFGGILPVTPLSAGQRIATLVPGTPVPAPRDRALLFTDGGSRLEERAVDAVVVVDERPVLRWSRGPEHDHERAFLRRRAFRVFGHTAPASWLAASPATTGAFLDWTQETTDYVGTGRRIHLDGAVDGIEVGSRVLVDAGGITHLRTVEASGQQTRTVGPLTGPATELVLNESTEHDARTTVVYELLDELEFQDWELPRDPIPSGTTTIFLPYPEVAALEDGRALVLDDDAQKPLRTTVDGDAEPYSPDDEPEFLQVRLADATTRDLDHRSAHLLGNVVPASHGATIPAETIGDGDASVTLQTLPLAKHPVTHVSDALAPGGARNTLEILVDGVRWLERPGLHGAGPHDQVYVTEIADDASMTVGFGDGRTGARLPTGRANVVATYRQGLGREGNVRAGQITTALHRPAGLAGVVNPLAADGGVDPQTTDEARLNAPDAVRTFDRAISLCDFADLAREFAGVAKALATWVWDGEERVAHVTVGGEDGAPLGSLSEVRAYLDLRRDPNRALRLGEYRPVPFVVAVTIEAEPDHRNDDVTASVAEAITAYFDYDARTFAQAVHSSDIYAVIHEATGVVSAVITELRYKDAADAASHPPPPAPVLHRPPLAGGATTVTIPTVLFPRPSLVPAPLVHAPILPARHDPETAAIVPAELAVLDPADLTVDTSGGLTS